jgi:hypothetical protein
VADEQQDNGRELTPEQVEHVRKSLDDARFRARLWAGVRRWAKAFAAAIITTHATLIVLEKAIAEVKLWLASLIK